MFLSTNIVPILLHDPGKGELAWGEDELGTFYDAVDLAKADLDDAIVIVARAGKNRSVAMVLALIGTIARKPSCDAGARRPGTQQGHDRAALPEPPTKRARTDRSSR